MNGHSQAVGDISLEDIVLAVKKHIFDNRAQKDIENDAKSVLSLKQYKAVFNELSIKLAIDWPGTRFRSGELNNYSQRLKGTHKAELSSQELLINDIVVEIVREVSLADESKTISFYLSLNEYPGISVGSIRIIQDKVKDISITSINNYFAKQKCVPNFIFKPVLGHAYLSQLLRSKPRSISTDLKQLLSKVMHNEHYQLAFELLEVRLDNGEKSEMQINELIDSVNPDTSLGKAIKVIKLIEANDMLMSGRGDGSKPELNEIAIIQELVVESGLQNAEIRLLFDVNFLLRNIAQVSPERDNLLRSIIDEVFNIIYTPSERIFFPEQYLESELIKRIILMRLYAKLQAIQEPASQALIKYMRSRGISGVDDITFESNEAYYLHYTKVERDTLLTNEPFLLLCELNFYKNGHEHRQYRNLLLHLLTFDEFTAMENTPRIYSEEANHSESDEIEVHEEEEFCYSAEELVKKFVYQDTAAQVKAAYRLIPRFLKYGRSDLYLEEWDNAPVGIRLNVHSVISYFDYLVGDILNHERFSDLNIAEKFTYELYRFCEQNDVLNEVPASLLFCKAYFASKSCEKLRFYSECINCEGDYFQASIYNSINIYVSDGDFDRANVLLKKLQAYGGDDNSIAGLEAVIKEGMRKSKQLELVISPQPPLDGLSNLDDIALLYTAAATHNATARDVSSISIKESNIKTYLVNDYLISHRMLKKLLDEGVLRVKPNTVIEDDIANITARTLTSLPMEANVVGIVTIEQFKGLIDDEINRRLKLESGISEHAIKIANSQLKLGWLFNTIRYRIGIAFNGRVLEVNHDEIDNLVDLVDAYSPSELSSIAYNAVIFVTGSMKQHGFGENKALERILPRVEKSLHESKLSGYAFNTFPRNHLPALPLEIILKRIDGLSPQERYITK